MQKEIRALKTIHFQLEKNLVLKTSKRLFFGLFQVSCSRRNGYIRLGPNIATSTPCCTIHPLSCSQNGHPNVVPGVTCDEPSRQVGKGISLDMSRLGGFNPPSPTCPVDFHAKCESLLQLVVGFNMFLKKKHLKKYAQVKFYHFLQGFGLKIKNI